MEKNAENGNHDMQQEKQQEQQKARQRSARPMVPPTSESEEEPSWHEIFEFEQTVTKQGPSVASSSYEEIPKNQSYFTYETIEPEIKIACSRLSIWHGPAISANGNLVPSLTEPTLIIFCSIFTSLKLYPTEHEQHITIIIYSRHISCLQIKVAITHTD